MLHKNLPERSLARDTHRGTCGGSLCVRPIPRHPADPGRDELEPRSNANREDRFAAGGLRDIATLERLIDPSQLGGVSFQQDDVAGMELRSLQHLTKPSRELAKGGGILSAGVPFTVPELLASPIEPRGVILEYVHGFTGLDQGSASESCGDPQESRSSRLPIPITVMATRIPP